MSDKCNFSSEWQDEHEKKKSGEQNSAHSVFRRAVPIVVLEIEAAVRHKHRIQEKIRKMIMLIEEEAKCLAHDEDGTCRGCR